MNRFCLELSQLCRDALLDEKWVLAPSLRVGYQWLDRITLAGAHVVNARVKTLKSVAMDLAGPEIVLRGLSLVSSTGSLVIVSAIAEELSLEPSRYLASLALTPGLAHTILSTITAVRQAGLPPEALHATHFEAPEKAADLAYVLTRYVQELRERKLVDFTDVLAMAEEQVRAHPEALEHVLVIVPEDLDLTAVERAFLDCLPRDSVHTMPVDQPSDSSEVGATVSCDAELLRWVLNPPDAPPPLSDGAAEIFHASGEANEVREVLRRCLSGAYRLDEVEVLHTDTETYVPLVYETFMRLEPDPQFDTPSLPVTFADGLPVRYARPGRLLAAWMEWMDEGFPQILLLRMIQEGLLEIPDGSGKTSFADLASALRSVRIGMGRGNYLLVLGECSSEVGNGLHGEELHSSSVEDPIERDATRESPIRDVEVRSALTRLVGRLLELSPDPASPGPDLLSCAAELISTQAQKRNEFDNYAAKAILERIEEMRLWIGTDPRHSGFAVRDWLASLPGQIRVGGSGPRPGCLHVAQLDSGGHSGRSHTFVMGLDDARFPGAGLNDPLLLDAERENLSPDLPKAASQLTRRVERLALLLSRLRGTVTLSFSSLDLADDRSTFPCSSLLSAYRILSGNHKGDQTEMTRWLPLPSGFAPDRPDRSLDLTEWWLWRLCGPDQVTDAQGFVERLYPHLGRGSQAAAARESADFTEYDGHLFDPPSSLDPFSNSGPAMSAARLEQMGRCPLSYFFKYVLRIVPPDSVETDPGKWLDPGPFGELLHEIFYRFMRRLIAEHRRPSYKRDRAVLFKILEEHVKRYARTYPPARTSAFERQQRLLERAARIFLIEEEELCHTSQPQFLEAAIGLDSYLEESLLQSREPVSVTLSTDRTVRLRARIDRIDFTGTEEEPVYVIWDYKTGSAWKYEKHDALWQGRIIQHAVYLEVARHMLRKRVSPAAEVSHFGYFFPGQGARGLRLLHWKDQLEHARDVIEKLCLIASTGAFLATDNAKADCTYCDYNVICRDVEATAAAARRKLENPANEILEPVRQLRGVANDDAA